MILHPSHSERRIHVRSANTRTTKAPTVNRGFFFLPVLTPKVNEVLLLLLRQYRSQADLLDDLGALLHGIRELVVGEDEALATKLDGLEAEAKDATSLPKRLTLQRIDDTIRKLESLRPPHVN